MKKLEILIGDELHRVVYIEYSENGIPHNVDTIHFIDSAPTPYWRLYHWAFFANNGDIKDIRFYIYGSGGSHLEINAPQFIDGYIGKYWIADDAKLDGIPKNAIKLKNPIPIADYFGKKSRNPFKIAEIANDYYYCEICGEESTDFCEEHMYIDEAGNEQYRNETNE